MPDFSKTTSECATARAKADHNGGDVRANADQRLSRTVTPFQARRRADRRIFPLTTCPRRCVSCVQTLQFCAASLSNDVLSSHGKTGVRRAADSLSDDERGNRLDKASLPAAAGQDKPVPVGVRDGDAPWF